jgi:hypothetical protein
VHDGAMESHSFPHATFRPSFEHPRAAAPEIRDKPGHLTELPARDPRARDLEV